MEFHMINITYAALHMHAQTEKTTFSCKDDRTLKKHTWRWTHYAIFHKFFFIFSSFLSAIVSISLSMISNVFYSPFEKYGKTTKAHLFLWFSSLHKFLDAIASQEIPSIQVTYSLTHSLTDSQSANNLPGQGSRPFRQSKDVKKGYIVIIITAIMAIKVRMATAAIMAITDNRAITASTSIRANYDQYN